MSCTRCGGLVQRESIHRRGAWWWRCYACGDRVDRTILLNRAVQAAALVDCQLKQERDMREWEHWLRTIPQQKEDHARV